MKTLLVAACALLYGLTTVGCQRADATVAESPGGSMKGYELYSWQAEGEWRFSLLIGTNREKTLDEIQDPAITRGGVDALRTGLAALPTAQAVTWRAGERLEFPPDEIIRQVEQICAEAGLELQIVR
jgi:hypothetical protein